MKRLMWTLPLLAIVVGALSSFMFFQATNSLLRALGERDSPTLATSQSLVFDFQQLADGIKSAVAAADKDALQAAKAHAQRLREHLQPLKAQADQAAAVTQIERGLDTYLGAAMRVAGILMDHQAGDVGEAAQAMQAAHASLTQLLVTHKQAAQQALDAHIEAAHDRTRQGLAASVLAYVLILSLSLWVSRHQLRALMHQLGSTPEEAAHIVQRIASGDLSQPVRVKAEDEGSLLDAMRRMQEQLAHVIGDVHQAAHAVRLASGEIHDGNQALADRSARQATHLQSSAASVEQLTASVRHNADSAEQAQVLAAQASQQADAGSQAVSHAVSTMNEVAERARKIVEITALIDGIAFQTNILALNAAVEAARAGEHGRGFNVVAGEVRTLAQRAAAASKEIKTLIEDSAHRIEQGAQHVNAAGAAMDELVQAVHRVGQHITHISEASCQQRAGIDLVNQAVAELDASTHENHALVEQAAQAARALQDVAHQLSDSVGQFKLAQS